MIKTALGAQRYNNRMDKIFQKAKELNEKWETIEAIIADYKKVTQGDYDDTVLSWLRTTLADIIFPTK